MEREDSFRKELEHAGEHGEQLEHEVAAEFPHYDDADQHDMYESEPYRDHDQKEYIDRHSWSPMEDEHTYTDEDERMFSIDHYNEASEDEGHEDVHHETVSSPKFLSTATSVFLESAMTKFLQNDISVTKFLETSNDITVTKFLDTTVTKFLNENDISVTKFLA